MTQLPLVMPAKGFGTSAGQFWGTVRAEIVMQWRRWGLWLAFAASAAVIALIYVSRAPTFKHTLVFRELHFTPTDFVNFFVYGTTTYSDMLFAMVAALLVADRLMRDKTSGMSELQRATTQGYPLYVLGKFVGNLIAVLVPAFIGYMLCGVLLVVLGLLPTLLVAFIPAFLLVFVPAFAVVVALALLLSSVAPVRVVQIGFPLLWLYSTLSPLGWYTLADTIFNPSGRYIFPIFFPTPVDRFFPGRLPGLASSGYTLQLALLNITVLLLTALASLVLLILSLKLQERREAIG
jgi:hypothetical protein